MNEKDMKGTYSPADAKVQTEIFVKEFFSDGPYYINIDDNILLEACARGRLDVVRYLIEEKKADPDTFTDTGETNLILAIKGV